MVEPTLEGPARDADHLRHLPTDRQQPRPLADPDQRVASRSRSKRRTISRTSATSKASTTSSANTRVFNYAMNAFGLGDMAYAKAFMRKVLTEGVDDSTELRASPGRRPLRRFRARVRLQEQRRRHDQLGRRAAGCRRPLRTPDAGSERRRRRRRRAPRALFQAHRADRAERLRPARRLRPCGRW